MLLLRDSLSIWDGSGCVKLNISELEQDYRTDMLPSFVVSSYSSAELRHFLALVTATSIPLIDGQYRAHCAGLTCLPSLASKRNNCELIPWAAPMAVKDPVPSLEG